MTLTHIAYDDPNTLKCDWCGTSSYETFTLLCGKCSFKLELLLLEKNIPHNINLQSGIKPGSVYV